MGNSNAKKHDNMEVRRDMLQKRYESSTSINFPSPPSYATATTSNMRNVNHNVQSNVNSSSKTLLYLNQKKSDLHLERTQNLPHDSRFNQIVNTEVATVIDKEKYNNENQTTDQQIILPKILTQNDFMTKWFSWKKEFVTYMKSVDPTGINKHKWYIMLLNRMGPIGQEIYNTFTFENSREREDINKVLKKFDFYCIFENLTREDPDETDKYVNKLTVMASKHMTSTEEIVKEKILMEVDKDKFKRKVEILIPGFLYPSSVQWLTIREMAYIWMSYENFDFKRDEKILTSQIKNCRNCGDTHALSRCRATGKKCTQCDLEGHFYYRCPSRYIANCKRCGEDHFYRQCPAYGNECHKCQKPNHFSWKCGYQKLLQCKFCNCMHFASKPCTRKNYY